MECLSLSTYIFCVNRLTSRKKKILVTQNVGTPIFKCRQGKKSKEEENRTKAPNKSNK